MAEKDEIAKTVLDAEFEDWRQLNAKVLHCSSKPKAMAMAFEAGWESAFDYALSAHRTPPTPDTRASAAAP